MIKIHETGETLKGVRTLIGVARGDFPNLWKEFKDNKKCFSYKGHPYAIPEELKSCVLEMIEERYPANEVLKSHGNSGHCGPNPKSHGESAEAVAFFRLTTGHDFLEVYLHWLGVAANEAGTLCDHAEWIATTFSIALDSMNIVSPYWEARRQMVKRSSMGVG
ncbi:hypothetical protein TNCV_1467121 [Trichonephila clavipes]|uniref:Uncharacterized protein n=1 Tax=Trichonephila clavipes TaxID=2585209 RepID=A0A8X6RZL1_TRICX|nr:hypothetical protein TNCV_1467121 [Trichonephila clavipes]